VSESPGAAIRDLSMLTDRERHSMMVLWNATSVDYPQDRCIHELFEVQAASKPDAVAVRFGGASIRYNELDARANQLAHRLQSLGVGPEVCVGVCVERSIDMVVALLGILKAGGGYVPLDPSYPPDRLQYMVADAAVPVLLTQRHLQDRLEQHE